MPSPPTSPSGSWSDLTRACFPGAAGPARRAPGNGRASDCDCDSARVSPYQGTRIPYSPSESHPMITRLRIGSLIASLLLIVGWSRPAAADLVLTLDMPSYTINGVGNTTAVEVFVSQNASGPQVGVGNEL